MIKERQKQCTVFSLIGEKCFSLDQLMCQICDTSKRHRHTNVYTCLRNTLIIPSLLECEWLLGINEEKYNRYIKRLFLHIGDGLMITETHLKRLKLWSCSPINYNCHFVVSLTKATSNSKSDNSFKQWLIFLRGTLHAPNHLPRMLLSTFLIKNVWNTLQVVNIIKTDYFWDFSV